MTDRPDIPEEAVEAAAKGMYESDRADCHESWDGDSPGIMLNDEARNNYRRDARNALQAAAPALRRQGAEGVEREREEWKARAKRRGKALSRAEGQVRHWQHNHNAQVNRKRYVSALLAAALAERDQALAKGAEEIVRAILPEVGFSPTADFAAEVNAEWLVRAVQHARTQERKTGAEEERERLREALGRLWLYRCPHHGLIDGGHYSKEQEWGEEDGCPLLCADEEECGEPVERLDLLAALDPPAPSEAER